MTDIRDTISLNLYMNYMDDCLDSDDEITSASRHLFAATALGSCFLTLKSAGYLNTAIADECVKMADAMLTALKKEPHGTDA